MFITESMWQICNPSNFPTYFKIFIVEFQRESGCKVNVLFLGFWFPDTSELLRNWAGGKKLHFWEESQQQLIITLSLSRKTVSLGTTH